SQNGGPSIPRAGEVSSAYHRYGSNIAAQEKEASFFEGIDISLVGIATLVKEGDTGFLRAALGEIQAAVEQASAKFSAPRPEQADARFAAFMGDPETMRVAIPGQSFGVRLHVVNQSAVPVKIERLAVEPYRQKQTWRVAPQGSLPSGDLAANKPVEARFAV